MADPTYDVEAVAQHLGNMLQYLKQPGGQDATGITQTGDVISQVGNKPGVSTAPKPGQIGYNGPGTATPRTGTFADGTYDGFGIGQEYGHNGHPGLDISAPVGTQALSPFSGTVTHASDDDPGGYGSWVEITGDDGTVIRYGHLSGMNVQVGEQVGAGTMIGQTGGAAGAPGAGNSEGPHLHFEVRQGGHTVDPTGFLAGGWQIFGGG